MSEHILEVRHLSKAFGSHAVLKDIDFTVDKGDVMSCLISSIVNLRLFTQIQSSSSIVVLKKTGSSVLIQTIIPWS